MAHPFFTVAIPVKNRPQRLVNAIRSVLAQTFEDFELIVCDNSDEPYAPAVAKITIRTLRVNSSSSLRVRPSAGRS